MKHQMRKPRQDPHRPPTGLIDEQPIDPLDECVLSWPCGRAGAGYQRVEDWVSSRVSHPHCQQAVQPPSCAAAFFQCSASFYL